MILFFNVLNDMTNPFHAYLFIISGAKATATNTRSVSQKDTGKATAAQTLRNVGELDFF